MPDVTPNFTGQSSNMRNSTNQSLQQAAMGVQQGGAEMTQIIGQLAQSLAQSNAMVMQSAQKMAKSAQTDRQSLVNAVGQTMEKMGQQINTAAQRRADRSADLKDAQTLQKSGRELADQSQVAAETREMERKHKEEQDAAESAKWQATFAKNYQDAAQKATNFAKLQADMNNAWGQTIVDPGTPQEVTSLLMAFQQDLRTQSDSWEGTPGEVKARMGVWATDMAKWQADKNAAPSGTDVGPAPAPPGFSIPNGIQLSEESRAALQQWQQSRLNAKMKGQMGPPEQADKPAAQTFTFADLGAVMQNLTADSMVAAQKTEAGRLRAERMLTEDAVKVMDDQEKRVAESKRLTDVTFPHHSKAARTAIGTSIMDTANWTDGTDENGKPTKNFNPKALITTYLQRVDANDPKVLEADMAMLHGKPLPLTPQSRTLMDHFDVKMQNFGRAMGPLLDEFSTDASVQKALKKVGYVKTTEDGLRLQENLGHAVSIASDTDRLLQAQPGYNHYKAQYKAMESRLKRGAKYPITAAEISGQSLDETEAKYGPSRRPGFTEYMRDEWSAGGEVYKWDITKAILGRGEVNPAHALADKLGLPPVPIRPLSRPNQPAGPRPPQAQGLGMAAQQPAQPQQPVQPVQPPMAPPEEEPPGPVVP